jgi:deazaflavin-dependent oxidoreductase (nitroreductase family)
MTSRRPKRLRAEWQQYVGNRIGRLLLTLGIAPPVYALLETKGRKTGKPRRIPVGNGLLKGTNTFWLISEYRTRAAYVRNILSDPEVRVKIGRRWHRGRATVLHDDDPHERQRQMNRFNSAAVRFFGSEEDLLTVRMDLDSHTRSPGLDG